MTHQASSQEAREPPPEWPACMTWELPPRGTSMREWQRGRCAGCGLHDASLVEDHSHETGLVRGYLCRSCNGLEGVSDHIKWDRWRAGMNPATILGIEEVYDGGWAHQSLLRLERHLGEATMDEMRAAINLLGDAG